MTVLTYNNQKEYDSTIEFQSLIRPWQTTKFDHDIGIDLYVQPFNELERDPNNKSLPTFPKRFLVQLKATESENQFKDKDQAKISIDVKHLIDWQRQSDEVLFLRYYISEERFYYCWISEVNVATSNTYQTIILNKVFDKTNIQSVKEEILDKILPPKLVSYDFYQSEEDPNTNIAEALFDAGRLKSFGYINDNNEVIITDSNAIKELAEISRISQAHNNISNIRLKIESNPEDVIPKLHLAYHYLELNDKISARRELNLLIKQHNLFEAKVWSYLIKQNESVYNFNNYKLPTLLKWERTIPEGAELTVFAYVDSYDNKIELKEVDEGYLNFNIDSNSVFQLEILFKVSPTGESPILITDSLKLIKGVLDPSNKVLQGLEELIMTIKL